jgi:hypothetical protein
VAHCATAAVAQAGEYVALSWCQALSIVSFSEVPPPRLLAHITQVLSSAFGSSAFLMLSHTKGQPLDALLHQLLGYCMAAAALAILAQGLMRWQSYVLDAARSLAVILEVRAARQCHHESWFEPGRGRR